MTPNDYLNQFNEIKNKLIKWAGKNHNKMKSLKNILLGILILAVLWALFFKTSSSEITEVQEYEKIEKQDDSMLFKGTKPEYNIHALADMITPFKEKFAQDAKVHPANKYIVESAELYLGSFIDNFVINAKLDSNLYDYMRGIDHAKYDTNVNYQMLVQNKIFQFNFK